MPTNLVIKPQLPTINQRGTFKVNHANADGSVTGAFNYRNKSIENAIIRQKTVRSISAFMVGRTYSVSVIMTDPTRNQVICHLNNRIIGQRGKFIPSRMISHLVIEGKLETDTTERDCVELHNTSDRPFFDAVMHSETNVIVIDKRNDTFICVPLENSADSKKVQYPDFMDLIFNQNGTVKIQKLTASKLNVIGLLQIQDRPYGMSVVHGTPSDIDKKELIGKILNVTVTGYDNNSERIICQFESFCEAPLPDQQRSLLKAYATKDLLRHKDKDMNLKTRIMKKENQYKLCLKDDNPLITDRMNRFNMRYSEPIRETTDQLAGYYSRIIEQYRNKEE